MLLWMSRPGPTVARVTAVDEAIRAKLVDFCHRFSHPYWNGPFFSDPAETVAIGQAVNHEFPPAWDVWMEKPGVPDSLGGPQGAPLVAAYRMDAVAAAGISIEVLAFQVAAAIAGREAHEALEFARLDGQQAVDPHGSQAELVEVSVLIAQYLTGGAQRD